MRVFLLIFLCLASFSFAKEGQPAFRSDDNPDKKLPWYQPVKGEFPPEGSAHKISGELIWVDHAERELHIRVDRDDTQSRAVWDMPLLLTMLPYGSIEYNGQPAALQDIPLGTHLHTWCYLKDPQDKRQPLQRWHQRTSPKSEFRQCIRIEDDFSFHSRLNQMWSVEKVDLEAMELTVKLLKDGKKKGDAIMYKLMPSTMVYHQKGFGRLEDLKQGQELQMNLTWVTLRGPGRAFQIWVDEESRQLASQRQLLKHRDHIKVRGIPGWVASVDDKTSVVSVTFFDGIDLSLFESFNDIVPEPLGWPTSGGAKDDMKPKGTLAVARDCLMTFDIANDRKGGNILKKNKVPVVPGCSGVQIELQCDMLLEGYRPGKIVRFFPSSWKLDPPPKEEQFFGRE